MRKKSFALIAAALGFALLVPLLGYVYLGTLYASIFLIGYLGGFLLWLGFKPNQTIEVQRLF